MTSGGGFCEEHGPFDPPHTVCPFCARKDPQRRDFGPPPGFERATVEPEGAPESPDDVVKQADEAQFTEFAPPEADPGDMTAMDMPHAMVDMERPPLAWLIVKEPLEKRGEVLTIKHGSTIGREADVRWSDPRVSRQHARFRIEPLQDTAGENFAGDLLFHIWPLAPTNPVMINGRAVRAATPLYENDEIRLGDTLFVFKTLTD